MDCVIMCGMVAVLEPEWSLGDRLRKAREVAGLSRDEMAAKLGTTPASVWNWENDKSRPRDVLATLYEWSTVTGVNFEWLVKTRNFWVWPSLKVPA